MKTRGFEKVSFNQFKKDCILTDDIEKIYNNIVIPKRATKNSAGYDICTPFSFSLEPGASLAIPTGLKAYLLNDEVLNIYIRSSMGFKYNLRMCNQVGIIDSDYYNNNENEGHIFIKIKNEGSKTITFNSGDRIVQGIFIKYLTCDNDIISCSRNGGLGSTGI